jgi:hypothetical protein
MNTGYKNSVLLVAFTFASNCNNIERLKKLYAPHFKQIIFYSNGPLEHEKQTYPDVHYLGLNCGWVVYRIFEHFQQHYLPSMPDIDGIFYTMDDNILNVNILSLFSTDKILYEFESKDPEFLAFNMLKTPDGHCGWHWDRGVRDAVYNVFNDPEFKEFGFSQVRGQFADYFYLPKRYLTPQLFKLFQIFARHSVSLEVAIPSILSFLEPNRNNYHTFRSLVWWYPQDRELLKDRTYLINAFTKDFNLVVHPVKFNNHPEAYEWLEELFTTKKKRCVVITTINQPSLAVQRYLNNAEYETIIVGDAKTPSSYRDRECTFLDIDTQDVLFPELSKLIPRNHYGRKNLGYLYAINRGYDVIYETDDDNIPLDTFESALTTQPARMISDEKNVWINIYKYFTNNAHIWPRGYPLSCIKRKPHFMLSEETETKPSLVVGLVKGEPDVDAIFRLTCHHAADWEQGRRVLVSNRNICVFNSQNTWWTDSALFISMILPSSVSFRYCDILRAIITNILLQRMGRNLMVTSPTAEQQRNEHNLLEDFKSEVEMYIWNETILDFLENNLRENMPPSEMLREMYKTLAHHGVITDLDEKILAAWIRYFV